MTWGVNLDPCQGWGRRFEPGFSLHYLVEIKGENQFIRIPKSLGTSGNIKDLLKVSGTFQEHVLSHPGSLCQFSQNQVLRQYIRGEIPLAQMQDMQEQYGGLLS